MVCLHKINENSSKIGVCTWHLDYDHHHKLMSKSSTNQVLRENIRFSGKWWINYFTSSENQSLFTSRHRLQMECVIMMSSPATMAIVFLRHMNVIATMTVETTVMKITVKVSLFQSHCYARTWFLLMWILNVYMSSGADSVFSNNGGANDHGLAAHIPSLLWPGSRARSRTVEALGS